MSSIGKPIIIKFGADSVKVSGPNKDGGYTLTFATGEYEQGNVADILRIPQQTNLKVTVEVINAG